MRYEIIREPVWKLFWLPLQGGVWACTCRCVQIKIRHLDPAHLYYMSIQMYRMSLGNTKLEAMVQLELIHETIATLFFPPWFQQPQDILTCTA